MVGVLVGHFLQVSLWTCRRNVMDGTTGLGLRCLSTRSSAGRFPFLRPWGATVMSASSDLRPRPSLPGRVPLASRGLVAAVSALLATVALSDLFAVFAGVRIHMLTGSDDALAAAPQ